jgi:hypothetical protein
VPVFVDYAALYTCFGALYDEAKGDSRIAPRIRDAHLNIQFRYRDPDAQVTIAAAREPSQPDAYFDVIWGPVEFPIDVEMSMQADIAHAFWHGRVNLMTALARRQIIARGPIPQILRLLPAVEPMYAMYPRILQTIGRDDLIIR